jgi:hypothetical protein
LVASRVFLVMAPAVGRSRIALVDLRRPLVRVDIRRRASRTPGALTIQRSTVGGKSLRITALAYSKSHEPRIGAD